MIRPFLKWAGGKTRALPELLSHLPPADLLVEPFVGGASVFLNTDYKQYILADSNYDLINVYRNAAYHTDLLIDAALALFDGGNTAGNYYSVREHFNSQSISHEQKWHPGRRVGQQAQWILRAAQFIYLNRHCYNGICRYNKSGGFNTPYGKYKTVYFPENEIRQFAEKVARCRVMFVCADFSFTLSMIPDSVSTVIYCDPPYIPASKTANFTQYGSEGFDESHHLKLALQLTGINQKKSVPVIISNSDTAATREIYELFDMHKISVRRSVSADSIARNNASEIIGFLRSEVLQ